MTSSVPVRPRVLRIGAARVVVEPRPLACAAAAAAAVAAVVAASLLTGSVPVSAGEVARVLAGGGSPIDRHVVLDLRLGRAIVAVAVGGALGFAGALTQSVAGNPLASPDVLGVPQGAALAAVAAIVAGAGPGAALPPAALAGALSAAALIWLLSGAVRGGMRRVALIGVGASMFLSASTTWLLSVADLDDAATARLWLTGSLAGRGWSQAWPPLLGLLAAAALAGPLARGLAALSLGATTAHVLGVAVRRARAAQLSVAVALTALAVSAAGPIGFVAFVAPQLARRIGGTAVAPLPLSALVGAFLLAGADLAVAVLVPWEVPVGVATTVIGAPLLLATILRGPRTVPA